MTDLATILAEIVREQDRESGIDPAFAFAQHKLLHGAQYGLTFLGKTFNIEWPDGEPPCLREVLNLLVETP